MPVSELDPRTALIVIDLQRGVVGLPTVHPVAGVVANAARLADAFRASDQPVVLVNVFIRPGVDALQPRADLKPPPRTISPEFAELVPEMRADPNRDILITKRQWGAFFGTELDLQLRRRKITGIVLCGIATSIGVESTARAAYELGYNQSFAADAMTDLAEDAHDVSLKRIMARIGEVGSTDDIIAKLNARQRRDS